MTRNSKPSNSLNPAAPPFLLSSYCSQHSSVSTYINVFFTLLQCFVEPTLCQYFGVLTLEYYQSTKELDFDARTLWCRVTFWRKWYCNEICMPYSSFIFLYIIWSDHACYLRVSAVWTHFRGNPGPITLQVADVCLVPDWSEKNREFNTSHLREFLCRNQPSPTVHAIRLGALHALWPQHSTKAGRQ